ncbi:MAG: cellulose binding domain-containing protein, partial [Terracidiphilus sp.]
MKHRIIRTFGIILASAIVLACSAVAQTCKVVYTISPQGSSQFGATVSIQNTGTTTLSNWSLTWSFANGQTIAGSWNGT